MKRKNILRNLATSMAVAGMMFSSIPALATESELPELPESIIMDGKEFIMDKSAGGGSGTATPDNSISEVQSLASTSYQVTGSDVRLYVDYSNGHGGDHYAHGWVQATAPRFTARAEVWANGKLNTTGSNNLNNGNIAYGTSYLATGIVKNAEPRIFYAW